MSILTTIYGASDDLVEITSVCFGEELNVYEKGTVLLSDGTEIEFEYDGTWVFRLVALGPGTACVAMRHAVDEDDTGTEHTAPPARVPGYSGYVCITTDAPLTSALVEL